MSMQMKEYVTRTVVVALKDEVVAFNVPELRERFYELLEEGVRQFVVDLSDVTFMDSAGMGLLVSVLKRARQEGGDVKLVLPRAEGARRIFALTKFDRVFDVAETAETAVRLF
ncbi:MAG: anti-sigma factor antagonist [Chloroflexi bacterium]|nr:MAG: anti-sigma factor antagonist [Chloroflexota bacterium]